MLKSSFAYLIPGIKIARYTEYSLAQDICSYLDVSMKDIQSSTRLREVVYARGFIAYFMKRKFPFRTLEEIGEVVNRDHSTITKALERIAEFIEVDENFRNQLTEIEAYINNKTILSAEQLSKQS